MLAGIAAARAFNNIGIRGVAPFAKIAGSNWLVQQSLDGLEAAWYSGDGANEIAVTNNSWGTYYSVDTFYEDIMQNGVKDLRDGKGRIYVFASGNAREQHADANIQYIINNQYAVVVGALEYNNSVASYSTPGANLWISSYGGSKSFEDGPTIATTYLSGESTQTWDEDSKKDYTYAMAGSSAAAPMVSAEIALLLEACPNLTWRDVKYILAKSAKKVDAQNSSWVTNSAGFNFSRDYGFGAINLQGAIDICQNNYSMLPAQKSVEVTKNVNENIGSNKIVTIGVNKNYKIEWVEATIDIDSDNASKIDIYITSPSGTKVQLVKSGTLIDAVHIPTANWMKGGFRFSTGAFLDEESIGDYKIEIVNSANSKLNSIKLKVYGH
jgi:kexin